MNFSSEIKAQASFENNLTALFFFFQNKKKEVLLILMSCQGRDVSVSARHAIRAVNHFQKQNQATQKLSRTTITQMKFTRTSDTKLLQARTERWLLMVQVQSLE